LADKKSLEGGSELAAVLSGGKGSVGLRFKINDLSPSNGRIIRTVEGGGEAESAAGEG